MKFTFIVIVISLFSLKSIKGQESFCNYWYIEPLLYNNHVSDTTQVDHWENYWHDKSGNESKLIPDTLQIVLDLIPSMAILPKENFIDNLNSRFKLKSTLVFKYGRFDRSYNVISPKISDTIVLLDEAIDLISIYNKFIGTDEMGKSFYPKSIKIKEVLDSLNISIEDREWDYEKRGNPYALNQIIITTYFINLSGKVECSSEFTFPINGAYNNPHVGKWEF
jgi:hypothetical protein